MKFAPGLSGGSATTMLGACDGGFARTPGYSAPCWPWPCWRGRRSRSACRRCHRPLARHSRCSRTHGSKRAHTATTWRWRLPDRSTRMRRGCRQGMAIAVTAVVIACRRAAWCCWCHSWPWARRRDTNCRRFRVSSSGSCRPRLRHRCDRPSPDSPRGNFGRIPRLRFVPARERGGFGAIARVPRMRESS